MKLSLETRQKMSASKKGKMPKFIPNNLGRVRTPEMREHYSEVFLKNFEDGTRKSWNKGRKGFVSGKKGKRYPHLQGPTSPKWKGGTFQYWRNVVLIRDSYTCGACGLCDPEIVEVDHIKSRKLFPELQFDLKNLITLCPNCHVRKTKRNKEHSLRGKI